MAGSQTRSPQAREDILDIWRFIAEDSEDAATALILRFDRIIQMLADNPRAGRERMELARGIRSFAVGNYVIFYLPTHDGIDVIRVLHGARDVSAGDLS
jgi:toxin ParE1/3/4